MVVSVTLLVVVVLKVGRQNPAFFNAMKNKIEFRPHEDRTVINSIKWFDMQYPRLRRLLFHIANGGSRNIIEAVKFKRMGVRRGTADHFLSVPNDHFNGCYIEFKRQGQYQSADQKEFQKEVEALGYKYCLVFSVDGFVDAVQDYLRGTQFYKPSWKDAQKKV